MKSAPIDLLMTGASELGIPLSLEQAKSLLLFVAELKKWNRRINLTAIIGDRDVVVKHLLDSLSYIKGFNPEPGIKILDMGSGAGFPAIPILIACPGMPITMVESVKKKASFLRHIARTLQLQAAEIQDVRTDEVPSTYENTYDVVTARAFADMASALTAGLRFIKTGGLMVLSRGPEETLSEEEMIKSGVSLDRRIDLMLPHSDYSRAIWVFRKERL